MLPPNLYGEGHRVRPEWLFRFLKDPDSVSPYGSLRPLARQRMPKFRLSDEEANALVKMFLALAGRPEALSFDPADAPLSEAAYAQAATVTGKKDAPPMTVGNAVAEAQALFDTMACVKCHLPPGTPGADPNEGGSAPPFTLAGPRLRREWIVELLKDPQSQINGTKMVQFWTRKGRRTRKEGDTWDVQYPDFQFGLRGHPHVNDALAREQMESLARWILYHYPKTPTAAPAAPPPAPPAPAGGSGEPK
jgi:hypothetical protein